MNNNEPPRKIRISPMGMEIRNFIIPLRKGDGIYKIYSNKPPKTIFGWLKSPSENCPGLTKK
jgi:hypothetical protein